MIARAHRGRSAAGIALGAVVLALTVCKRNVAPKINAAQLDPAGTPADGQPVNKARGLALAPTPMSDVCRTLANALPVARLVIEWQEEDIPRSFALDIDGSVRTGDRLVAHVSGPCIIDTHGNTLLSLEGNQVIFGAQRDHIGVFRKRSELRDRGRRGAGGGGFRLRG